MKKKRIVSTFTVAFLLLVSFIPVLGANAFIVEEGYSVNLHEETSVESNMVCSRCGGDGYLDGLTTEIDHYDDSHHLHTTYNWVRCIKCGHSWKNFFGSYLNTHTWGPVYNRENMLQRDCNICHYTQVIRWRSAEDE